MLHGSLQISIEKEMRTYDGFKKLFEEIPNIEGVVAYTKKGQFKIRRNMFESLEWPCNVEEMLMNEPLMKLSDSVALK